MLEYKGVAMMTSGEWPDFEGSGNGDILFTLVRHKPGLHKMIRNSQLCQVHHFVRTTFPERDSAKEIAMQLFCQCMLEDI